MKNPIKSTEFEKSYSWGVLSGLPSDVPIRKYPPSMMLLGGEIVIRFNPNNNSSWIGVFDGPDDEYLSGVFPTPHADKACIVAKGEGFIVNINKPEEFSVVPILPILNVYPNENNKTLVFVSFTDVAVLGAEGMIWKARVACDGIEITEISKNIITGKAWDSTISSFVSFEINLDTGNLTGGACTE